MPVIDIKDEKDMTSSKFRRFVKSILGKKHFILFVHADWCGHCQHVKPVIERVVKKLKTGGKPKKSGTKKYRRNIGGTFVLVKISDDVARHINSEHSKHLLSQLLQDTVQGYPTIISVSPMKDNELRVKFFDKERNEQNLVQFFTRHE